MSAYALYADGKESDPGHIKIRPVVLHSVYEMGCNSVVTSNIHSGCTFFGFTFYKFINVKCKYNVLMCINGIKSLLVMTDCS